jgi:UDP-N-acetylmuramate dehydrogenase
MNHSHLSSLLKKYPNISVKSQAYGTQITHFRIGGPLKLHVVVETLPALITTLEVLTKADCSWRIIGAGSNLLISDAGLDDCIIKLGREFNAVTELSLGLWSVGASAGLMRLSQNFTATGWEGLEFAAGIPGTLGGGVVMNAGAHGTEISSLVQSVVILHSNGVIKELPASAMQFQYRSTIFNGSSNDDSSSIVLSATLKLRAAEPEKLLKTRGECLAYRKATQPLSEPSAGSVFTNPSKEHSAGRLIEQCGLKGYRRGFAQISEKHANWIVNPTKNASSSDVEHIVEHCQNKVLKSFGVELEPEICVWT